MSSFIGPSCKHFLLDAAGGVSHGWFFGARAGQWCAIRLRSRWRLLGLGLGVLVKNGGAAAIGAGTRRFSARTRRRRWVFWLKVPAALLHRPPCADGSGRRAGTPVPTVPGQRRRVGRAASVAGPAKDWFLTALLDLAVPQHDHAVGRRATDTVRARSALGSDGR